MLNATKNSDMMYETMNSDMMSKTMDQDMMSNSMVREQTVQVKDEPLRRDNCGYLSESRLLLALSKSSSMSK